MVSRFDERFFSLIPYLHEVIDFFCCDSQTSPMLALICRAYHIPVHRMMITCGNRRPSMLTPYDFA